MDAVWNYDCFSFCRESVYWSFACRFADLFRPISTLETCFFMADEFLLFISNIFDDLCSFFCQVYIVNRKVIRATCYHYWSQRAEKQWQYVNRWPRWFWSVQKLKTTRFRLRLRLVGASGNGAADYAKGADRNQPRSSVRIPILWTYTMDISNLLPVLFTGLARWRWALTISLLFAL